MNIRSRIQTDTLTIITNTGTYLFFKFVNYFLKLHFFNRHVILPPSLAKILPKTHLLSETEWRNIGIQQSPGWTHYMIHGPGNIHMSILHEK